MERREGGQLELFSSADGAGVGAPVRHRDTALISRVRVFEKTVLMLISIIITALVAYTAGIEKGKRRAGPAQQPARNTAVAPAAVQAQQPVIPFAAVAPVTLQAREQIPAAARGAAETGAKRYTIQLASYKTRSAAEKEGTRLKKLGYTVIIQAKGPYTVVNIGNFSSKEKAQSLLSEMRPRYKGCYVRQL